MGEEGIGSTVGRCRRTARGRIARALCRRQLCYSSNQREEASFWSRGIQDRKQSTRIQQPEDAAGRLVAAEQSSDRKASYSPVDIV